MENKAYEYQYWLECVRLGDWALPDEYVWGLTEMEKAILFLLELGFSKDWIQEHFEFSRQAFSYHLAKMKKRLSKNIGDAI